MSTLKGLQTVWHILTADLYYEVAGEGQISSWFMRLCGSPDVDDQFRIRSRVSRRPL